MSDQNQKTGPGTEARYPLVIIIWEDHQTSDDWHTDKDEAIETFGSLAIHSTGWLVNEDEKSFTLASMICVDDGRISMLTQILKGTVVSKKVLCP